MRIQYLGNETVQTLDPVRTWKKYDIFSLSKIEAEKVLQLPNFERVNGKPKDMEEPIVIDEPIEAGSMMPAQPILP